MKGKMIMTKIERKLKELGYKRSGGMYYKEYKSQFIFICPPMEEYLCMKRDGYLSPNFFMLKSDEQVKDIQIAWNRLKSDLKEIKKIEEK